MKEVLFLTPVFKERIWGGRYFKDELKNTDLENVGEMWSVSAHPEGETIVSNGPFLGLPLSQVYQENPELFAYPKTEFPILIKLIAAEDDLSIQVHPDDIYAREHENQNGKTEGWLILEAAPNSKIILGHNSSKEELLAKLGTKALLEDLNSITVKVGNFYPIPSGTIHALGKKIVLLEIQQSSDVTYRLYDYDRLDKNKMPRPLHLKEAAKVIKWENSSIVPVNFLASKETKLWNNHYFQVDTLQVEGQVQLPLLEPYGIITVVFGEIKVFDKILHSGESFIIPNGTRPPLIAGSGYIAITTPNV